MTGIDTFRAVLNRRARRGKRVAAGMVGLALILGTGACDAERAETAGSAPAPGVSASSAEDGTAAESPGAKPSGSQSARALSPPEQKRVAAARKNANLGKMEITRSMPQRAVAPMRDLQRSQVGDQKAGATMRLVSARSDLTGQQELGWVADKGEPVGKARCTKKIQLSNNSKAGVRKNLLICWRTSATKSVFTVTVDRDGKPSKRKSVAAIAKRWAEMR
jgi:hypothetical protein